MRRAVLIAVGGFAGIWLALALCLGTCSSMTAFWRYRALENRAFSAAEVIDSTNLALARTARYVGVPGARIHEASALAQLAETEGEEGELSEAKGLYQRSIRAYERSGKANAPELAIVLSRYAVLLRDSGETEEAGRAYEKAQAILSHLKPAR